jgi:hypothetical protein
MMILMLMGDWFLDLMVLDQAFGFSSEGERVGERDDEQRLNLVHINERKWGACGCS